MGTVVFVLGGTRSGKSAFALRRAAALQGEKIFVATAQAGDAEMSERIRKHREERGSEWQTYEESLHLGRAIREVSTNSNVIVVDCLTIWLSNLLCDPDRIEGEEESFVDALRALPEGASVFIVSNEVGMGIVPENDVARTFRDLAGKLNARIAGVADEVFLVVAGRPLKIK